VSYAKQVDDDDAANRLDVRLTASRLEKVATMPQERRSRGGAATRVSRRSHHQAPWGVSSSGHAKDASRGTAKTTSCATPGSSSGEDLGLMDSERNHGDVVGPDPVKSATH
jgi:hypothetical protein